VTAYPLLLILLLSAAIILSLVEVATKDVRWLGWAAAALSTAALCIVVNSF
jgi:hypothetical protein